MTASQSTQDVTNGSRVWFFPDGDIPPPGDAEPHGHESLVILNPGDEDAVIEMIVYYEDREPDTVTGLDVPARRVRCFRVDGPVGDSGYRIPFGQYALKLHSTSPIICQLGRMDVRQPNLAYYTVMGYSG